MNVSIRYTKGLGNSGIYARIWKGSLIYDFSTTTWIASESEGCRIYLTEYPDSSVTESWYAINFPLLPIGGPYNVDVIKTSTGELIGNDFIPEVIAPTPPTPVITIVSENVVPEASSIFNLIELNSSGEGHTTINLGSNIINIVTKYNYSAICWTMDIYDINNNLIVAGIMLVPRVGLLNAYPDKQKLIGNFVLIELNSGDYMSPDLLGINTSLLWFSPGITVVIP